MKANELRLGNRARIPAFTDFVEVELSIDNIKDFHQGLIEIKPIPLTEEWLVKFGFEKRIEGKNYHGKSSEYSHLIIYKRTPNEDYYMMAGYRTPPIQYVHQLQNLYHALTGEELEIK